MINLNVPDIRVTSMKRIPLRSDGRYVLYWMTAARRLSWNFALQHAAALAHRLNVGLLVFEPLPLDYPDACARFHRFILDGMMDNQTRAAALPLTYYPWVETREHAGAGLLEQLAAESCVVVTDLFPGAWWEQQRLTAAKRLDVPLEVVDGNGLLPLRLVDKAYPTAYAFRRLLHKALPAFIDQAPLPNPLTGLELPLVSIPDPVRQSWPMADLQALIEGHGLSRLPVDQLITAVAQAGGNCAAQARMHQFIDTELDRYGEQRNIPDLDCTSRLAAYLHFGQLSVHEIFSTLARRENWSSMKLQLKPSGKRTGWWGMSSAAEAFLDELVTWRELGYGFASQRRDFGQLSCLPDWARETLNDHRHDQRPYGYSYDQFRQADTHDPLWNAAQTQLLDEGRIHGYLRMLWGKKIIEWSESPEQALNIMLDLNNRFALDGNNPNSFSGICWCLGLFDRPWGPERPVFGKVRYMTSQNTARKVSVKGYLQRYSRSSQGTLF